jgi:hypothetical protein
MIETVSVLGAIIIGLIWVYGKSKQKIGEIKKENNEDVIHQNRESDAKEIESQPPPVSPDDVADAWAGMRHVSRKDKD